MLRQYPTPEVDSRFDPSRWWHGTAVGVSCLLWLACGGEPAVDGPRGEAPPPPPPREEVFSDRAREVGIDFVHWNGRAGELYISEVMAGGAALFDYDQDGDLDAYLNQGHLLGPGKAAGDALEPPPHPAPWTDRLYRNDLAVAADGSRTLRFTDVTEQSGISAAGYGMGVAVGDVDNDGWPDLYVANWGSPNQLFRNQGDGTFRDITGQAGVGERRWSVAAAFVDVDRDGWLDLMVTNYLDFSYSNHKECTNEQGLPDYCGPVSYKPVPDVLFRNTGPAADGSGVRFEAASGEAGLNQEPGTALGVVSGDFNNDGWIDLYVANDELPNHLLINQAAAAGAVRFRDEALLAGAAMNSEGHAEAGMGVHSGDVDNDGDEDLFVSHLSDETNTLYLTSGEGFFDDRTVQAGLGMASFANTGFGTSFLDYDNDGWLDLLVVNGAVQGILELVAAGDPYPLHQKNQLFHNLGEAASAGVRFEEVSERAGAAFELSEVSRGAAFGDIDNDGDPDVLIHNNSGPARLLVNNVGQRRSWVGLRLIGKNTPRDMLGAWVELSRPGRPTQGRRVRTEGSYASASDPRVLFGLGDDTATEVSVRVRWPDGSAEQWHGVPTRTYTTLRQGSGAAP